jgi:hypothetical protein
MSYATIARNCGFDRSTAKRCAKKVTGRWLRIGIKKGRYVPGKGNENLYDGTIPKRWKEELRRRLLSGHDVEPDEDLQRAADEAMACVDGDDPARCEPEGAQDAKIAFALFASSAARCGLPCPETPDPWLKDIAARLRDSGGIDAWRRMLAQVEVSPYLRGDIKTEFRVNLEWVLKPRNFQKVLSGQYAPKGTSSAHGSRQLTTPDQDLQRLASSPNGQEILVRFGRDEGMRRLRAIVSRSRSGEDVSTEPEPAE